ncbi:hypothetical protein JOD31_001053 [Methylopila capsulata]|uniref:HNH endonuclease n=1 Tax=Methylopila capsulata TaxID=61654 RepID=A0A9W6IVN9_9HYPH|nr:hypothetical protein [Methylopila capsulata]MBM7850841.1 hypothetical protein [Methylopila capsulata]GLK56135.1 hypothetical protein GCM10008170_21540 [Methylopila capsulata]
MSTAPPRRYVGSYVDAAGRDITEVELANGPRCRLLTEDFRRLEELGIRPHWTLNDNGGGRGYVTATKRRVRSGHGLVRIARIIARAEAGQIVRYRDRSPLNLISDNLIVARGDANGREAVLWSEPRA